MKSLNFAPLLVFMLVFPSLTEWTHKRVYGNPPTGDTAGHIAICYIAGCAIWLVIGTACAIGE